MELKLSNNQVIQLSTAAEYSGEISVSLCDFVRL